MSDNNEQGANSEVQRKCDAVHRISLTQILYSIDAIAAAVRGSDFNDKSQQRGIVHLLSEQYCQLSEVIDEMGGKFIPRDWEESDDGE